MVSFQSSCQLIVFDANSTPTGILNLRCSEERNFIQFKQWYSLAVKAEQLWGCPRPKCLWGQGQGPLPLGSSTLLHSALVQSFLLWGDTFLVCSTLHQQGCSQGNAFSSLWGKVHSPSKRGAGLYGQKSLQLVSDWSVLLKMRTPNP